MFDPQIAFQTHREEVARLIDGYRTQCLWFLREDFYPTNAEEAVRVLSQIERNADLKGFQRAAELRSWFSPSSSEEAEAGGVDCEDSPFFKAIVEAGLVGCIETDEQLSITYKERLADDIRTGTSDADSRRPWPRIAGS